MSIIRNVHWLNETVFGCAEQKKFSRTSTIHPGIFLGRALWADSVSPRMDTIASRDQSKPIRIGENLIVNYKWLIDSMVVYHELSPQESV